MKYKNEAIKLAKRTYFAYVELDYMGEYKGYEVYDPIADELAYTGLPIMLILNLNDKEKRETFGYEETFEFRNYFEGKKAIETISIS